MDSSVALLYCTHVPLPKETNEVQTEVGTSVLRLGLLLPSVRAILESLVDPEGFVKVQARESDVNREFPVSTTSCHSRKVEKKCAKQHLKPGT